MSGGDVSVLVNFFSDTLKAFVREFLLGRMSDTTKEALQGVVNDLLLTVPRDAAINGGLIDVDYGLINEGVVVTD